MDNSSATASNVADPQQFPEGEPSRTWTPDELGRYAQVQHQAIVDGEKCLAPVYWRLGNALALARKQNFNHGQWGQFLRDLGVDRTRACKATAIFRAFSIAEEVAATTVENAYAEARRRKASPSGSRRNEQSSTTAQTAAKVQKFLTRIRTQAVHYVGQLPTIEPEDAQTLAALLEDVLGELTHFQSQIKQLLANDARVSLERGHLAQVGSVGQTSSAGLPLPLKLATRQSRRPRRR